MRQSAYFVWLNRGKESLVANIKDENDRELLYRIIGGADGPTAIFLSSKLAPELIGAIAIAAYSYMALVPVIQPPIIKLLTSKEERRIKMKPPRAVSKTEKMIFPIVGLLLTTFISPGGLPLLGMLFFGNLLKESGVTKRLADTASKLLSIDYNAGKGSLRNGLVASGLVRGFAMYKSNNVRKNVGGNAAGQGVTMFGHMRSTSCASAMNTVESFRSPTTFADQVRGLHVYGRKVIAPQSIGVGIVNIT